VNAGCLGTQILPSGSLVVHPSGWATRCVSSAKAGFGWVFIMMVLYYIALVIFYLVSLVLVLSILVQESKSSGLGASFGGDAGDSLFGTSTPEVLRKFTASLAWVFVGLSLVLSLWTSHLGRQTYPLPETTIESPLP
jgi:preprotein translocase subunit SecG